MSATVCELSSILSQILLINKSRIKFISEFILALIKVRTVNLVEISQSFSGEAKLSSVYRKIQRFFLEISFCKRSIAEIVALFYPCPKSGWMLSMDRTNWDFGIKKINILMLSINVNNMSIPILWMLLPKKGNSNTRERKKIMTLFISYFGSKSIGSLLCDREFVGKKWIRWLKNKKINFTIRIKGNSKVINKKGKTVTARTLFYITSKKEKFYDHEITLWSNKVFISGMKLVDGCWLIIITNYDLQNSLNRYKCRWNIAILFANLKTRGFNLESTHLKCSEKLDTLIALLTITVIIGYKIGEDEEQISPTKVKKTWQKSKKYF